MHQIKTLKSWLWPFLVVNQLFRFLWKRIRIVILKAILFMTRLSCILKSKTLLWLFSNFLEFSSHSSRTLPKIKFYNSLDFENQALYKPTQFENSICKPKIGIQFGHTAETVILNA